MSKSGTKIRNKKPVADNQKISKFFTNFDFSRKPVPKISCGAPKVVDLTDEDVIAETPERLKPDLKTKLTSRISLQCKRKSETIDTSDILDDITNGKKTNKSVVLQIKESVTPAVNGASTSFGRYPDQIPDMIVQSPPRKKLNYTSGNETKIVNLSELSSTEFEEIQTNKSVTKVTSAASPDKIVTKKKTPEKVETRQIFNSTFIATQTDSANCNNIQQTPEKEVPMNGSGTSKYFASGKKKSPTPTKRTPRKTPQKKLFSKSPNIDKFKVQVLQDFVIISPSQSNIKLPIGSPAKNSIEKKQKSILNYVSPRQSQSSSPAQLANELTPVRQTTERIVLNSTSKAKVKLNFSCDVPISTSNDATSSSIKKSKMEEYTFEDSLDDTDLAKMTIQYNLDLSDCCHCKILEICKTKNKRTVTILVQSTKSEDKSYCVLKDIWVYTPIEIGSTVRITATKADGDWEVTQKDGLLVLEPDVLLSATVVVSSMYCKRKTALKEKFYGFDPSNKAMIVGNLVHSLLQSCLRFKANTKDKVEKIMHKMLKSKDTYTTLYFASINYDTMEKEVGQFVPRIVQFIEQYLFKKKMPKSASIAGNWNGTIDSIHDIEENIWCPDLGLKGKVDITAKNGLVMMPLELKTGRASISIEHQGQILFYIMMMRKLGYNVPSGFLLYLREGKFQEILMNNRDSSHLINIRNELAYYLTRKPKIIRDKHAEQKLSVETAEMPEPINRMQSCRSCEFNVICSAYLRAENKTEMYPYFKPLQEEVLGHLEQKHLDYFVKWNNMIELENAFKPSKKCVWEIFTIPPKEREKKGQCITNVCVTNCIEDHKESYIQTFVKKNKEAVINFFSSGIGENSYVVVSTDNRPAVASGLVASIDFESITIALDRNLLKHNPATTIYHLDTYDSHSANMFLQSSLCLMLEATPAAQRLRAIVVDREPTSYVKSLHKNVLVHGKAILARLDRAQRVAVLKALQANEYVLIKGMPGTGKTATIVALVQLLVALDQTVLITSHTNLAVDNVCIRLIDCNVPVLRLGAHSRTHEKIRSYSEFTLTEKCNGIEDLDKVYSNAKVVAVTCIGSKHPLLTKRTFDVCIVDESTQVIQCSLFRAITSCNKFILIGDPDQLEPVVTSRDAKSLGLGESLFKILQNDESTVLLNLNYRMNKTITDLANKFTYNDLLKIGSEAIANATLRFPKIEAFRSKYVTKRWIMSCLDDSLPKAVTVVDTGPIWNKPRITWNAEDQACEKSTTPTNTKGKTSNQNPYETSVIVTLVYALLQGGVLPKNIGVMAPYVDQVTQLSPFLSTLQIDVSTIDKFQGQDKEVIFFSGTKSLDQEQAAYVTEHHILESHKRLTVAITRSKHKLIIVGDLLTLNLFKPFRKLFEAISAENVIRLKDDNDDFKWESVVNLDEIKI